MVADWRHRGNTLLPDEAATGRLPTPGAAAVLLLDNAAWFRPDWALPEILANTGRAAIEHSKAVKCMETALRQAPCANPIRRVAFGDFPSWTKMIRPNIGPAYAASFVDLGNTQLEDFDAIIPVQLNHYAPLMRRPDLLGRKFIHPSAETISLCDDKLRLSQFLMARGFGDFVPTLREAGPPYPYIRKKRRGWWGMHCQIVAGPRDEINLDPGGDDWFVQALIPGPVEFATHILRAGGQIRYASTFRYKMSTPAVIKGARDTPLNVRFHAGCMYLDLFGKILQALDYEGTACIDYKVVDRRPVLFEINPRFGGSLSLDITAYLDAYFDSISKNNAYF